MYPLVSDVYQAVSVFSAISLKHEGMSYMGGIPIRPHQVANGASIVYLALELGHFIVVLLQVEERETAEAYLIGFCQVWILQLYCCG